MSNKKQTEEVQQDNTEVEDTAEAVTVADDTEAESSADEQEVEKDIETQLEEALAQAAEYKDGWQRARAELDNARKRLTREREQMATSLQERFAQDILPVLDDFDLALENIPENLVEEEWVEGIRLIYRKLLAQLEDMGVSEIECEGQAFDPVFHEAVMQLESEDHESGQIVGVLRKGYMLKDRVIRATLVQVAT